MAKNRYINTRFWSDNFVVEINPLDRYLFLYFLTNEHTNIAGVYELPLKTMSFETGLEKDMLLAMLRTLKDKVYYIDGWIFIRNFAKHQAINDSVKKGIERVLSELPENVRKKLNELCTAWGQAGYSLGTACPLLEPKPKPKLKPPIRAKARTDKDGFYDEATVELDNSGEIIEQQEEFKLKKGFHARLSRYYMETFNVPKTKGVYFTYKKYIDDMVKLARELHGENEELIEQEIKARIDVAKKYAEKMNWGKVKLATILENWNIILEEWRKEVEI